MRRFLLGVAALALAVSVGAAQAARPSKTARHSASTLVFGIYDESGGHRATPGVGKCDSLLENNPTTGGGVGAKLRVYAYLGAPPTVKCFWAGHSWQTRLVQHPSGEVLPPGLHIVVSATPTTYLNSFSIALDDEGSPLAIRGHEGPLFKIKGQSPYFTHITLTFAPKHPDAAALTELPSNWFVLYPRLTDKGPGCITGTATAPDVATQNAKLCFATKVITK